MPPLPNISLIASTACEVMPGSLGLSGEARCYEILGEPVNCVFYVGIRNTEDMNTGFWVFHSNSLMFSFFVNLHNAIC